MKRRILAAAVTALSLAPLYSAAQELIQPIKPPAQINIGMVELGKKLYFDPRLSKSGFISCNSCHNLSMGGTDNIPTSIGDKWQQGPINAPTVLNSSLNVAQFWDGRAADLRAQAGGPIANPGEMGFTHTLAIGVLESIPAYVREFKTVFGTDKLDIDQVTLAIAEFEKTLVTPNSRFDQWLLGKADGAEGRSAVTGKDVDRFNFKVPTLRNVEMTYPYFHDGAVNTLPEAVDIMGRLQLGKKFTANENSQIVAFLKTLTGDQPNFALPILPPSSDKTPRPTPFAK